MSQFFPSGGQRIGVSALASVLPMNIQDWFPLGWSGWISLQSKGDGGALGMIQSPEGSSVQLLSRVWFFAIPWKAACQTFLSITNSWSLLKLMSIKSVMPSNHLIPCHPLLLLPSVFPSIRVFSSESVLPIRWPKDWSFSFSISPSDEYSGLISFRMDWLDLLAVRGHHLKKIQLAKAGNLSLSLLELL